MKKPNLFLLFMIILAVVLTGLYFLATLKEIKLLILMLILLISFIILVYFIFHTFIPCQRIKHQLRSFVKNNLSIDEQKKMYMKIYHGYCRLPEEDKQNFYDKIMVIRKKVAEHISNRTQLENHLASSHKTMQAKKKKLSQMKTILAILPKPDQQKYSPHVHHYSDKLEGKV
tara:strand:- start:8991 stop:9506 length:516 start_codon:yes stop_codon:yes gene_type:complete